jgi:hypothetical protein
MDFIYSLFCGVLGGCAEVYLQEKQLATTLAHETGTPPGWLNAACGVVAFN